MSVPPRRDAPVCGAGGHIPAHVSALGTAPPGRAPPGIGAGGAALRRDVAFPAPAAAAWAGEQANLHVAQVLGWLMQLRREKPVFHFPDGP